MARFSDNELKMLVYNAMARSSEAGAASISRLGLATNAPNGIVQFNSDNNSSYTIGVFQVDFGQRPSEARQLIETYNTWAKAPNAKITNVDEAARLIQLHGRKNEKNPVNYLEGREDLRGTPLWANNSMPFLPVMMVIDSI